MARKCKCHITGEIGTTDTFVKIGNYYYKNQTVYDADQKEKQSYKRLVEYISYEFLGYGDGQPFPSSLPKLLKRFEYYDNDVILEAFKECAKDIHYWLDNKQFTSEYGKLSYMFKIVEGSIADINKRVLLRQKQERETKRVTVESDDLSSIGTKKRGKDISHFLDDDDL